MLSFSSNPASDLETESGTAIIIDFIDEEAVENVTPPEAIDKELETVPVIEEGPAEVLDSWESFNEEDLEAEFGDVQTGIDLLNNPLQ